METLSKFILIVFLHTLLLCLCFQLVKTEETCSWMPDGSKVCNEETEEDTHNVWTEPLKHEEGEVKQDLSKIELEHFVLFAGQLKDWDPEEGLSKFNPEVVVLAVLSVFNSIDVNDDGYLDYAEIERDLLQRTHSEELSKIKEEIDEYPENKISIFDFFSSFKKFNSGKETEPLLSPFDKLKFLPAASAKKIIQGSVQMFIDSDKNLDGKLDKDEFFHGMEKAQEKRKEMGGKGIDATPDQLDALFTLVDKDKDEYLTYSEFQGTIPEKPKTFKDAMDEVFTDADSNLDGQLSEVEFTEYMKLRSKKENSLAIPTSKEISDVFEKLDANHDDLLSTDEMMSMFEEVKKAKETRITEAFMSFDKDLDGFLSLDELKAIVQGIQQNSGEKVDVNVFMTMLDQNMDRKVSLEEMTGLLTKLIAK